MGFNVFEQPEDVQRYVLDEWDAAQLRMFKDEIYVNNQNRTYKVLEDSAENEIYVKVSCDCNGGKAIQRLVPKIVLVS